MNKKRIWTLAFIFGLIATAVFYIGFIKEPAASATVTTEESADTPPNTESTTEAEGKTEKETQASEEDPEAVKSEEVGLLEIEEGKRAVSVAVDSVQGVSNFLKPGVFVDVALIYPPVKKHESPFAMLLFENIKVLATGESRIVNQEAVAPPYGMVTLELPAIDGAKLSLATEKGKIVLMQRPPNDSSTASERHLDESELHTEE